MPDLKLAKFAEEQKLAAKLLEPKPAVVETLALRLANAGLPMYAATVIASHISKLQQHCEVLTGFAQSQAAICAGLQKRIAELESGTPVHLRKVEKR